MTRYAAISFTASAELGDRSRAVAVGRSLHGRAGVYVVTITTTAGGLVSVFRDACYRIAGTVRA